MKRSALFCMAVVLWGAIFTLAGYAQSTGAHFYHSGNTTPGVVGKTRLVQGGEVQGYYQPVLIRTPENSKISIANDGAFIPGQDSPMTAGLQIGNVYRLCVTEIPMYAGREIYPSIELIDRIYPPKGEELNFPIVVEITQEDLELALSGHFVTRVVYLENPFTPLPIASQPDSQMSFDVTGSADPLVVADTRGRPVAIVRIGSRTPDTIGRLDAGFLFNSPPWLGISSDENGGKEIVHYMNSDFIRPGIAPLINPRPLTTLNEPPVPTIIRR